MYDLKVTSQCFNLKRKHRLRLTKKLSTRYQRGYHAWLLPKTPKHHYRTHPEMHHIDQPAAFFLFCALPVGA